VTSPATNRSSSIVNEVGGPEVAGDGDPNDMA
jgi:hypothetical protein